MKKIVKIGFPILCVAVVGGSLIALNDISHKAKFIKEQREKENKNNTSINSDEDLNSTLNNNTNINDNNTIDNDNDLTNTDGSIDNKVNNTNNINQNSSNITNNSSSANNGVKYSVPVN